MPNIVNRIYNPITGIFGSGNVAMWVGSTAANGLAQTSQTITWTIPPGVGAVRVRLWGGGGYGGGGGSFALKTINDLSGLTSVTILVGYGGNDTTTTGGTSSFGSFVSAAGGTTTTGGAATGGDINFSGGSGNATYPGGAASIFGTGATGNSSFPGAPSFGGAAGGWPSTVAPFGGSSLIASGGSQTVGSVTTQVTQLPTSGLSQFSIDFIGCGGGSIGGLVNGINGSGSSLPITSAVTGGIPGGPGRGGGAGMVIVEW